MTNSNRVPFTSICAIALLSCAAGAGAQQSPAPILQAMQHHVRPAVSSGVAPEVGRVPLEQRFDISMQLEPRNQAALTDLLRELSDPSSPRYRQWLTPQQFAERFGRTEAEVNAVVAWAQANELEVDWQAPNRLFFSIHGTAAKLESALHIQMKQYQHPTESRVFYSPDREPAIALDVPVRHVSGLNDFSRPHPGAGPGPSQTGFSQPGETMQRRARLGGPASEGNGSGPPSSSGGYSWLSSDMRRAYNMGTNTGTGQVVALMEYAGYNSADITKYFRSVGQVNRVPIRNVVVGGSATTWSNAYDNAEVCLDIEQVLGVAPGLKELRVYIGSEGFGSGVDTLLLNRIANDNLAKQITNSWYWFPDDPAQDDPAFQQMAAQGQTFVTISGDDGAYTGNDATDESYPGEDVNVLAVGGTTLTTSGPPYQTWKAEAVWNSFGQGSGGGPANDGSTFRIPSWQIPVINTSNRGSTLVRNTPDVAMEADYFNYVVYNNGTVATNWGGTSFAAPRWTAYLALVNQQLVSSGKKAGLGLITPTLFAIGQGPRYQVDFRDVVLGNNQTNAQASFYDAVAGYDLATGWGSPSGVDLMVDLVNAGYAHASGSP